MLRMMSFRTGHPSYEPAGVVNWTMKYHGDRDRRTAPDDGARKRTVRRLMVMRLRGGDHHARGSAAFRPPDRGSKAGASCADGSDPRHGLTGARGSPRPPVGTAGLLVVHQPPPGAARADTTMYAEDHDPGACP